MLFAALPARAVPVLASGAIHVSIAASLVAVAGGHRAFAASQPALLSIETVELPVPVTVPVPETPPVEPRQEQDESHHAGHTHPYPVPPSHDEHPHDPSIVHKAADAPPAEASPAAPVAVATSEATSPAPRFTIAFGASTVAKGPVVATGATGSGHGHDPDHADGQATVETVTESMVSVPARLVASAPPAYPPAARAGEIESDVPVDILVDTSGRVVEASSRSGAGYGFGEAAVAAVRGYRFSPAQRSGKLVRVRMRWIVQFRLR
jgi:TonB family protein